MEKLLFHFNFDVNFIECLKDQHRLKLSCPVGICLSNQILTFLCFMQFTILRLTLQYLRNCYVSVGTTKHFSLHSARRDWLIICHLNYHKKKIKKKVCFTTSEHLHQLTADSAEEKSASNLVNLICKSDRHEGKSVWSEDRRAESEINGEWHKPAA